MFLLLESGGPENVKCVCQALKLCGYELELDCPRDMSQIISNLQCLENTLDVSTTRLLNSVIDLKSKRWGRNELEPVGKFCVFELYLDIWINLFCCYSYGTN